MLFIVGSETKDHRDLERLRDQIREINAELPPDLRSRTEPALALVRELKKSEDEEGEPEKHGVIYRSHPSLNQRIVQLKRLGAKIDWNDRADHSDLIDGIFVGLFLLVIFLASR